VGFRQLDGLPVPFALRYGGDRALVYYRPQALHDPSGVAARVLGTLSSQLVTTIAIPAETPETADVTVLPVPPERLPGLLYPAACRITRGRAVLAVADTMIKVPGAALGTVLTCYLQILRGELHL
jgi:hypothetical protein